MEKIAVSEVRKDFGRCIEFAENEPIIITRKGKPELVLVAKSIFDRMLQIVPSGRKP